MRRTVERGIYDPNLDDGVVHRVAAGERIVLRDQSGIDRAAIVSIEDLERLEKLEE